uniref:Phosphatidylinositol-4-phosphate 3-kinase n=1 Tax=Knipowitschia caucasica TaxID=637954 RepID=A0AAV2KXY1_KNICA
MEEEALAKLQRGKRPTLPTATARATVRPTRSHTVTEATLTRPETLPLAMPTPPPTLLDKDLIVFPESKPQTTDVFRDIDVNKLSDAELERLLLDPSPSPDPSQDPSPDPSLIRSCPKPALLGFNLSASYPGGLHGNAFNSPWTPLYPAFPAAQKAFPQAFTPQPFMPVVFPSTVDPETAKLLNKIASTREYLKNGRSSGEPEATGSLQPKAFSPPETSTDSSPSGRCDWLDLDPLSKGKPEPEPEPQPVVCESDPWEAVLKTEGDAASRIRGDKEGRGLAARRAAGAAVTRSHSLGARRTSQSGKRLEGTKRALDDDDAQNMELLDFCRHITQLRRRFPHSDSSTNPGLVLSPVIPQNHNLSESCSVKVCIETRGGAEPVTFTCDVSSPVELLVSQTLCWVHDDLDQVDFSQYLLKVCGQQEVLQSKHSLGSHVYIQNCRKWESDISLQLLRVDGLQRELSRTAEDDAAHIDLEKHLMQVERPYKENVTRQGLADYLEGYHSQLALCLQDQNSQYQSVGRLVQTVKNLLCALDEVETSAVTEAVKRLQHSVNLPRTKVVSPDTSSEDRSLVEEGLTTLTQAVYDLIKLYLRSFCCPSPSRLRCTAADGPEGELSCTAEGPNGDQKGELSCVCEDTLDHSGVPYREASGVSDHLQFTLSILHGLPHSWVSSYEKYFVMCSLSHNGRNLLKPVQSRRVGTYKNFFYHVRWDELVQFPMAVAVLPLEAILSISLMGVLTQNSSGSPDSNRPRSPPEALGKVSLPLFDYTGRLVSGPRLLGLWTSSQGPGAKGRAPNERIVLQLDFSTSSVRYVSPTHSASIDLESVDPPEPELTRKLERFCSRASSAGLKRSELQLIWDHRLQVMKLRPLAVAKVLSSAPCWDWASVGQVYSVLKSCSSLPPEAALELLHYRFSDSEVRTVAVSWIQQSSDDELSDYLPQLVQALKFECRLKNALVLMLLKRALGHVGIAHYLYWLLKDAVQDVACGGRCERVLGALLCLCGAKLRAELETQTRLVTLLGAVAERVKAAAGSQRQVALQEGLENVQNLFERSSCRLPLSPSLEAKGLNIKACSFFNSNAVPLKLALVNADPLGQEINVMFKVGEDLRQDMLALQMIRIMDRIWLQEGLDLRMVHFKCISTGKDKGMVELVPSSETLRRIQVEYGVTGSFKDKPLAEWLRKFNPAEDEYDKASENFTYSCAGCCVATYVLGICDRHNDNIMLRSSGHMFHIDFGKFLGHAQMFGSFKRDRAPFVLTSDMAYVINGGEKPTSRFQLFVDLCCQAFNLLRANSGVFMNLLSLMTCSGLPELTGVQDLKYVCDALQPNNSDAEATIFFTRLIESSLGSVATKFNFFIHNLAQLRFSGLPANDEPILSFSPKTYSLRQDGHINQAAIFSFQKRYSPDKHYTYVVRVIREGQPEPQFIFRTFDEFQELHTKLSILFPLWKLPSFPNKMVLGRTHVKDVATKRKLELNNYVHNLLRSAEVSKCDLVYTFFHPIARDDKTGESALKIPEPPPSPVSGRVEGEVKLSVSFRNNTLFIMIMHIRDLVSEEGSDPNPYVKTYLLPDPNKTSKRKTKTCRKTRNPTFNEMLVYSGHRDDSLALRDVQLSVLSAESLRENYFLGGVTLHLRDFDLRQETVKWYKLTETPLF